MFIKLYEINGEGKMNIEQFYGQPIQNLQSACNSQKIKTRIIDTNNDGILDKNDVMIYNVQKGDSLYKIGRIFDGRNANVLKKYNKHIADFDKIHEGNIIRIPMSLEEKTSSPKTQTSAFTQNTRSEIPQMQGYTRITQNTITFNNIKTKQVQDYGTKKKLVGNDIATLRQKGFFVEDKNNNGIFDENETLHKQVTVMLDAGHGSGEHLAPRQTMTIPGQKGKYITRVDDTFSTIATLYKVDKNALIEQNKNIKFSRDPGAEPKKIKGNIDEATFTGIARNELGQILEQQGFKVLYNVRTDGVASHRAARRINKLAASPDMFISLHCDGSDDITVVGETVIYNPENLQDQKFAQIVNKAMSEDNTFKNRGAKKMSRNLGVLMGDKQGKIAEILVEMGFVTSQQDYDKLANGSTRKKQLEAIAKGVLNYYQQEINPKHYSQIASNQSF